MNIHINLLPPNQRRVGMPMRIVCRLAGIVLLILFFSIGCWQTYQISRTEESLRTIRSQLELLQPIQTAMTAVAAQRQTIQAKQELLIKLTRERPLLFPALEHINAALPEHVWLTEFELDWPQKKLIVAGMSRSYKDTAAFFQRLEQDTFFSGLRLEKSERADGIRSDFLRFRIVLALKE